jgi:membrane protease YdiL (CAAX protease family)
MDSVPSPPQADLPPQPITTEQRPSPLRKIFLGPHGIRAGWRFLMYLLMVIALGAALLFMFQGARGAKGAAALWIGLAGELASLVAAVVPAIIMARIEKRSFGSYGLPAKGAFGTLFWVGALWGLIAVSLLLGAMRGAHAFYFGHLALHGLRILKFALYWGVFFLLVGFFEEFLLRGYTQFTLTTGIGFWPAAILLSALFGGMHLGNPGEAWVGALSAGLIGLFFCLTLRRTGNLWWAVGFHMSFDWGETFLYSVPNSGTTASGHLLNPSFSGPRWLNGGTIGPEGSIFVFILIALLWVVFDRLYPHLKYPERVI